MFRPVSMVKIDLQVPQDYVAKTTCIISDFKKLHLINIRKSRLGAMDFESPADSNLWRKYTELKTRLRKIFTFLEIDPDDLACCHCKTVGNPHQEVFEIEHEILQLEEKISCFIKDNESPSEKLEEKQGMLRQAEIFSTLGVDMNKYMDRFRTCRFLYITAGLRAYPKTIKR